MEPLNGECEEKYASVAILKRSSEAICEKQASIVSSLGTFVAHADTNKHQSLVRSSGRAEISTTELMQALQGPGLQVTSMANGFRNR